VLCSAINTIIHSCPRGLAMGMAPGDFNRSDPSCGLLCSILLHMGYISSSRP
jgi:hypothetical protein